jgi:hypothetical protein
MVETVETRVDGQTSVKRRSIRDSGDRSLHENGSKPEPSKSASTSSPPKPFYDPSTDSAIILATYLNKWRRGAKGKVDYTGCISEEDFDKRSELFYMPPEPVDFIRKGLKPLEIQPPPQLPTSSQRLKAANDPISHKFSDIEKLVGAMKEMSKMSEIPIYPAAPKTPIREESLFGSLLSSPDTSYQTPESFSDSERLILDSPDSSPVAASLPSIIPRTLFPSKSLNKRVQWKTSPGGRPKIHVRSFSGNSCCGEYIDSSPLKPRSMTSRLDLDQHLNSWDDSELQDPFIASPILLQPSTAVTEKRIAAEQQRILDEQKNRAAPRYPSHPLIQQLDPMWSKEIRSVRKKSGNTAIVTTVTASKQPLDARSFATLLGDRAWLNDYMVTAYLEYIIAAANNAGSRPSDWVPRMITQSTFFYPKLSTQGPSSVRRWTSKLGAGGLRLLKVELVIIPVNNASHWTIIAVKPTERIVEYYDSFHGNPDVFLTHTRKWLELELGAAFDPTAWVFREGHCPSQKNGFDCGVFALTNAECLALGLSTDCYEADDMAMQRKRIAAVILNQGFKGTFEWGNCL